MPEAQRIVVPATRLPRWLDGWAHRQGMAGMDSLAVQTTADGWQVRAGDGWALVLDPRWPLARAKPARAGDQPSGCAAVRGDPREAPRGVTLAGITQGGLGSACVDHPAELAAIAATMAYTVLVVRRAGYLVAVVESGQVVAGKVSGRHINGRTAAGGWSQKRYERRRGNQADEIAGAAAAHLADLVAAGNPAFLATGGDRPLIAAALGVLGPASPVGRLPRGPHFQIGTPNRADLGGIPERVTEVTIEVHTDPVA